MRLFMMAVLMTIGSMTLFAQGPEGKHQRISREQLAEKQAHFIAKKVKMDNDKTTRFVETYCQYQKEIRDLGPRQPRKGGEGDSEARIKQRFERSQQILDIRKDYYKKYRKFLSDAEIEQVYQLEHKMKMRFAHHGKRPHNGKPGMNDKKHV